MRCRLFVSVAVAATGLHSSTLAAQTAPVGAPSGQSTADSPVAAHDDSVRALARFYHGRDYGTEAQFNPLSEILNEGLDQLRNDGADRRIFRRQWSQPAGNVWHSITHPGRTYSFYGWSRALHNEILPLTTKYGTQGGGEWVPNYEFHLLGSGMVSARMVEWYEQHDVPHPVVLSALTMAAAHFTNEVIENGGQRSYNEDATTDLLVFDPAGFLLFRSGWVQRLFSGDRLQLLNWPGQATLSLPDYTIDDVGQEFVLRWGLPFTHAWRGFYAFGMTSVFGLSRSIGGTDAISLGFGADAIDTPIVDARTGRRTVVLKPSAGLYYDRGGSLLGSVVVATQRETPVTINLYPNALPLHWRLPGLWVQTLRSGGVRFGIAPSFGVGAGWARR